MKRKIDFFRYYYCVYIQLEPNTIFINDNIIMLAQGNTDFLRDFL